MKNNRRKAQTSFVIIFFAFISICFSYNLYTNFFPISASLGHDEAEHLHVAYLLSIGQKPFVDFIENHPMLFDQFLWRAADVMGISSPRGMASLARTVLFIHFLLCILLFFIWISKLIETRPKKVPWLAMLISSWAVLDLMNPFLATMWEIRPDFICYAYTSWGSYLLCKGLCPADDTNRINPFILIVIGSALIGFGNAVLPKGILFLLPLLLTVLSVSLMDQRLPLGSTHIRAIDIARLGAALFSLVISFAGAMLLDCHLSHISPKTWVTAVFLLNSHKHIIYSAADDNPIFVLLHFFNSPFPVVLLLILWSVFEITRLFSSTNISKGPKIIWLFCIFTFIVNQLVPCYSNGVTWAYDFIPSLFAMACFFLLLILKLWDAWRTNAVHRLTNPIMFVVLAAIVWLMMPIIYQPLRAISQLRSRSVSADLIGKVYGNQYAVDAVLPASFTYLTGAPIRIPIKSRQWGYYFMLWRDHHFWTDCHKLGLGPDPSTYWRQLFAKNPPDAITFCNSAQFVQFATALLYNDQLDITWLLKKIRRDYVLMNRMGFSMYVRSDRVSWLEKRGWHRISPRNGFMKDWFKKKGALAHLK